MDSPLRAAVSANRLIEAKGSIKREAIRMALGQLADHSRLVKSRPNLAILVPTEPRKDLKALCESQGCALIFGRTPMDWRRSFGLEARSLRVLAGCPTRG
jgi:hypothetical protein